jgi:glucose/mannose-6-phosphate isomerase
VNHPQYVDTLGLWDATAGLPEQGLAATASAAEVLSAITLPDPGALRAVAIFGMGDGGSAGEMAAAHAAAHSSLPVWVGKGYDAPSFVGPSTLVFALSHSGSTEETCVATSAALERGAPVVVVAGGGVLADMAQRSGLPLFGVPGGLPASRAALGALSVPVLMTLAHLGAIPEVAPTLRSAFTSLQRRRDALLSQTGPAEQVARRIGRTIPLVHGSTGTSAVAARRWKTQVNLNAKTPAFCSVQPEICHNEVAGWGQHGDITRQVLTLVVLRHAGEHPQVARRFELVAAAVDEVMASVIPVWAEGDDDLSRFFDLALFGDFVSLFMAGREGTDPGPAPVLTEVEAALR